jgi:hypothetical protein
VRPFPSVAHVTAMRTAVDGGGLTSGAVSREEYEATTATLGTIIQFHTVSSDERHF